MDVLDAQYHILISKLGVNDTTASRLWSGDHTASTKPLLDADSDTDGDKIISPSSSAPYPRQEERDFDALQQQHAIYLDALHKGCFLDESPSSRSLGRVIRTLLEVCVRFCGLFEDAVRMNGRGSNPGGQSLARAETMREVRYILWFVALDMIWL
jgi:hypothetical protein